jgi:S-adenosylmethionine:tRNA ribosyltransferase-isomerase
MSLLLRDYEYHLPPELIARYPAARREESRMLVLHRESGVIEHQRFTDFPGYLRAGDLCVVNDARVIPARVMTEEPRLELLVLERPTPERWICWVKPGRRARIDREIVVGGIRGRITAILEGGERVIEFPTPPDLEAVGHLPLPPYLGRADEISDRERYQTVYARREAGAIAAPTAGLHFTPEILARVPHARITLQVGVGTFQPVKSEDITQHHMHREHFEIGAEAAAAINAAQRIVAIGTTSVRVLESCLRDSTGRVVAQTGSTEIFIHPPAQLQHVDALLTNFHLPKSTLLMLISAMAGRERVLAAYAEAVRERYRFFSYGDCMLIL